MKLNWNFLGGGVVQNQNTSMGWEGEYGYFLELHISELTQQHRLEMGTVNYRCVTNMTS